MSGVITPGAAANLVREIKRRTGLPVTLHSHDTAGLAACAYLAAIDAGVDAVETSISPFANGTSQPDTLRMLALLEGHTRRPRIDMEKLAGLHGPVAAIYRELAEFTSHANEMVESDTLLYQVPGGMLSNFRVQLRELKMDDRFDQVLGEIPRVREALGWPPLVTPISQIVGTQAMLNVKFGAWKNFSPQAMDIALGNYGKTPGPINPDVLALAEKNTGRRRLDTRPADALEPRMPALRAELGAKGLPTDDEACVLYAMFPREYEKLVKPAPAAPPTPAAPAAPETGPAPAAPADARPMRIVINGQSSEILIEEID
jgi:pyruvate carboxylase subunit B